MKKYYLFVIMMAFFIVMIFSNLKIEPKTNAKTPEFIEVFGEEETDDMMYRLKSDTGVDGWYISRNKATLFYSLNQFANVRLNSNWQFEKNGEITRPYQERATKAVTIVDCNIIPIIKDDDIVVLRSGKTKTANTAAFVYKTTFGGYTIPVWNHQNGLFTFFKSPFTAGYTSIQDKVLSISEENGSGKIQLLADHEVFIKNLKPKNKYKITRNDGEIVLPASCKYFLRGEKVLIKGKLRDSGSADYSEAIKALSKGIYATESGGLFRVE